MTPLIFSIWFSEFSLEAIGAFRSFRRYPVLSLMLGFSAAADLGNYLLRLHSGWFIYAQGYWFQKGFKYLLLTVLACYICGRLANDPNKRRIWIAAAALSIAAGVVIGLVQSEAVDISDKLKDASISADMALAMVLLVAWCGRKTPLCASWNLVMGALVGLLLSDAACSFAWTFWEPARHFFCVGEIGSLLIWNYAAISKHKLGAVAIPLGHRVVGERIGRIQ